MSRMIMPSFAKGELAPGLHGRVDTTAYHSGLALARNVTVLSSGGLSNRPGTLFIGPVKDHSYAPRFINFRFKTGDEYQLEFGDQYMRVIRGDGYVLEPPKTVTGVSLVEGEDVVLTVAAHGFAEGDDVFISDFPAVYDGEAAIPGLQGCWQLNDRTFKVHVLTANTFSLKYHVSSNGYKVKYSLIAPGVEGEFIGPFTTSGLVSRIYKIATPYLIADVETLKYTQSADVVTLTHPDYDPMELSRFDHDDWVLAVPSFVPTIPYPTGQTVTVNSAGAVTERYQVTSVAEVTFEESLPGVNNVSKAITGITQANPGVVTAVAHGFTANDEILLDNINGMTELNGRRFFADVTGANTFRLIDHNGDLVDTTNFTAYSGSGLAWQTFVRITTGATTADNTVAWSAKSGTRRYAVYKEKNGLFGLIGETENTSFRDQNIAPDLDISPPHAYEPFLAAGDFPATVSYYEQRRVFGGSDNEPDTSRYSKTAATSNFTSSIPLRPDDAITATLASREIHAIRHYVPGNDLIILTSGGEWRVNSGSDAAFSADTLRQKPQSSWGSSHLRPYVIGNTILFLTETNSQVRSLGFSVQIDGYLSNEMSVFSSHLFEEFPVVDWCYGRTPDSRIYAVRSDGDMLVMTFQQEQEIVAWTHWDCVGSYERASATRQQASDTEDAVYVVVRYALNFTYPGAGAEVGPETVLETVRYVERTHSRVLPNNEPQNGHFVDCGVAYEEVALITNLTYIADDAYPDNAVNEYAPVVTLAAGHGFGPAVPASGEIVTDPSLPPDEYPDFELSAVEFHEELDDVGTPIKETLLNGRVYLLVDLLPPNANKFMLRCLGPNGISSEEAAAGTAPVWRRNGKLRRRRKNISGLWHLEGQQGLVGLIDGNVARNLAVSSGEVTFDTPVARAHIGFGFISDVKTLPMESPQGTIQGRTKAVMSVTVRFEKSRGLLVGPNDSMLSVMHQRENEPYGEPTALLTGTKNIGMLSVWEDQGQVFLRQKDPLPMTITAITPNFQVGDE